MVKSSVYEDRIGNTLTVWFDDPRREDSCEEVGDDVILMKNHQKRVIGFELLHFRGVVDGQWSQALSRNRRGQEYLKQDARKDECG